MEIGAVVVHLCKVMEEGCGVDACSDKGDGPGVAARLGREGRQGCPHAVPTCIFMDAHQGR